MTDRLQTLPRRTQAERREETRARLLEATVACLSERGYAHTTTQAVVAHAGLSQGALFKHFASKAELLAAAAERLFPRLIGEYQAELDALSDATGDRVERAIELLWRVYHRPELLAAVELYVAARTDAELARALGGVDPPHRRQLHEAARALFPDAARRAHFDAHVELVLNAVQGAAVGGVALPDNPDHPHMLRLLADLTRQAFAPKAGETP